MPLADNLTLLQQAMRAGHVRHADNPAVLGRFGNAFTLWRRWYESKAALRDQNAGFAARLLPTRAALALTVPGLPSIPAGMRWAVDETSPNTITVAIDVAGTVTLAVTPPAGPALTPLSTPGTTRQRFTFAAHLDGLYELVLRVGSVRLTTLYVPVQRQRFLDFRELSRTQAFAFQTGRQPVAPENYTTMLALLYAADAAAACGQPALFERLATAAAEVEKAPTPVALYPHNG